MANFFLIDHSLKNSEGHHADYARCVGKSANKMGFLTTLATHRKFSKTDSGNDGGLSQLGVVRPVFRNTVYQHSSCLAGLREMKRVQRRQYPSAGKFSLRKVKQRVSRTLVDRRRNLYIQQFAMDCEKLFRNTLFTPHDHALLATVSELDLLGLAAYLGNHPRTMQVHWHLQFHFNLFEGRPPEYEGQEYNWGGVRDAFLSALSRLSYHSIHFYTTSEELADQYNRLDVGQFEYLPYPISQEFALHLASRSPQLQIQRSSFAGHSAMELADESGNGGAVEFQRGDSHVIDQEIGRQPIRIVCPGGLRREKGQREYLQQVADQLWDPYICDGRIKFVLQRPSGKKIQKSRFEIRLPEADSADQYVEFLPHPLSHEAYVDLVQSSDIGLLMYDSRTYYSRRAGILGELLASGKPVVVPAGSWLATQIQEPIWKYAEDLIEKWENRTVSLVDFRWESSNVPMSGGVLSFDHGPHPFCFELDVDPEDTHTCLQFDWHWPNEAGIFCCVEVCQLTAEDKVVESKRRVVAFRDHAKTNAMFAIHPSACKIKFKLTNAFHDSTASIKQVEVVMLRCPNTERIPIGQVGVIAADRDQIGECILEIIENLGHYTQTAQQFSTPWYGQHDPKRTISHLMAADYTSSRVA